MIIIILKYAKSHIYELHALLAGGLTFLLMFLIKNPVRKRLSDFAKGRMEHSRNWQKNQKLYRSRLGLSIIVLDLLLSSGIFCMISYVSPLIQFSPKTMWLSGILSLTLYALYDQVFFKKKGEEHE